MHAYVQYMKTKDINEIEIDIFLGKTVMKRNEHSLLRRLISHHHTVSCLHCGSDTQQLSFSIHNVQYVYSTPVCNGHLLGLLVPDISVGKHESVRIKWNGSE